MKTSHLAYLNQSYYQHIYFFKAKIPNVMHCTFCVNKLISPLIYFTNTFAHATCETAATCKL